MKTYTFELTKAKDKRDRKDPLVVEAVARTQEEALTRLLICTFPRLVKYLSVKKAVDRYDVHFKTEIVYGQGRYVKKTDL